MKKLLKTLTLTLLTVAICISAIACSSYGKLEKAIKNLGYEKVELTDDAEKEAEDAEEAVKIHVFKEPLSMVWIIEFNATEDMKSFIEESPTAKMWLTDIKEDGTAKEYYDKLVEAGYANGNCLVIPLCISSSVRAQVKDAVKNA